MLVAELQRISKILSVVSNAGSISELFRSTEISSGAFRSCSEFANLELWSEAIQIDAPKLVNTNALLQISNHLSSTDEIIFNFGQDKLTWKCKNAKGELAYAFAEQQIPTITHREFPWSPPPLFDAAVILASASCQAMTVAIGLYGVEIQPTGDLLKLSSSNMISISSVLVPANGYPCTSKLTLRPPTPRILTALLHISKNPKLDVTNEGIFMLADDMVAQLPLSSPLEHDIDTVLARFPTANEKITISQKDVLNFLSRASSLADKGVAPDIVLEIKEGQLRLEYKGVASSNEEYFLASGLDPSRSFNSFILPLSLIYEAMRHVQFAILDYLPENILILAGENPTFKQILGGKATTK